MNEPTHHQDNCWCYSCRLIGTQPSGLYIPRPGEIAPILADGEDERFKDSADYE